jgi:nitrite reductase (NADH) small subunit
MLNAGALAQHHRLIVATILVDLKMGWFDVGALSDVPRDRCMVVCVSTLRIAVCRLDEQLYAFSDDCLWGGESFYHAVLNGDTATCSLHGWRYSIRTGELVGAPGLRLDTYALKVVAGRVLIELHAHVL